MAVMAHFKISLRLRVTPGSAESGGRFYDTYTCIECGNQMTADLLDSIDLKANPNLIDPETGGVDCIKCAGKPYGPVTRRRFALRHAVEILLANEHAAKPVNYNDLIGDISALAEADSEKRPELKPIAKRLRQIPFDNPR